MKLVFNYIDMTTLTIDKNVKLPKTNFSSLDELYLVLQEKLLFESKLQEKAEKAFSIKESELIDF